MMLICNLYSINLFCSFFFFFQAEDGIRDYKVTGVQTCALPIWCVLRTSFVMSVLEAFPNQFREVRKNKRFRPLLRYRKTGLLISVTFARRCNRCSSRNWIIETPRADRKRTTILVLLDVRGSATESVWVLPKLPITYRHVRVRESQNFLASGLKVENVSDLLEAILTVRKVPVGKIPDFI